MNAKVVFGARVVMGLIFAVFGMNGFLNFIPTPPPPEGIAAFMNGMMSAPYFFPLLKGTEVVCGLLLLFNQKVPLALIVLAPICLQIFLFHAFMTPGIGMLVMPSVIIILGLIVATEHWKKFKPLFA